MRRYRGRQRATQTRASGENRVSTKPGVLQFTVNAGRLRAAFTALVHQVDASPPVMTSGRGAVAEAVSAVGEAAAAVRRLLGAAMAAVSPWEVAAAVSHGRLLAVSPPARLFSTSGHLEPAM